MLKPVHLLLYGIEGNFVNKSQVKIYIKRVKQSNPQGVVLCIDTEKGTQEKVKTQGAFNVYLQVGSTVYIDFLSKGFDMGAITKGKETHETWAIPWDDILFLKSSNINRFRCDKVSNEAYIKSAKDRIMHLLNLGYSLEDIKDNIPKEYLPMPIWIKDMLIEDIIIPLYYKQQNLIVNGLKSFGVQGMIIHNHLFPIEINRKERFAEKKFTDRER